MFEASALNRKNETRQKLFKIGLGAMTGILILPVVLILRQPDLGTAMLIFLVFLSVMLLTKLKLRSIPMEISVNRY